MSAVDDFITTALLEATEDAVVFWKHLLRTEAGRVRAIALLDKAPKVFSEWKRGTGKVHYRNGPALSDAVVWRDGSGAAWTNNQDEKTFDEVEEAKAHVDALLLKEGFVLR